MTDSKFFLVEESENHGSNDSPGSQKISFGAQLQYEPVTHDRESILLGAKK